MGRNLLIRKIQGRRTQKIHGTITMWTLMKWKESKE